MGMPAEIRAPIYPHLLSKDGHVSVDFDLLNKTYKSTGRAPDYPKKGFAHGLAIGPKHAVAILFVCRKTYEEGISALYENNHFRTYKVRSFEGVFVHHRKFGIGKINAAHIKHVTFGVPAPVKFDPQTHLGVFLDFVCDDLPNLESMMLRVQFRPLMPNPIASFKTDWPKERRGLLNTVAWTTKRHPTLKKAVSVAGSGGEYKYNPSMLWDSSD